LTLTTAGIAFSSIGASDGTACPATAAGNAGGRQHRWQRCGIGTVVQVGIDAGGNEATEGGGDCEREQGG
jgi:hypothetical protein